MTNEELRIKAIDILVEKIGLPLLFTKEDVEIFKKVIEDIIKDLGLPPNSPVRKTLEKSAKDYEDAVDAEETFSDYDRAMKGII